MNLTTECAETRVAIVGGGCAGVLVAAHLMRSDRRPHDIVIFEPRAHLGAGAAYGTDDQRHLLNAPARGMSAFEDEPSHFVAWLTDGGHPWGADDFVPRRLYRQYLQDVLDGEYAGAVAGTRLTWVREAVTALRRETASGGRATTVVFGLGQQCQADQVVLALGAPDPVALSTLDISPTFGMVRDPWCPGALDAVSASDDVLILGTGLTMIDVALVLTERGGGRIVHGRSRHGLLPTEHAADGFAPWPGFDMGRPTSAREVLHRLRQMTTQAEVEGYGWRNVIAAARTAAPYVWGGLAPDEQRRLLRHLGRKWEVARHRMAIPVAATVNDLRRAGRLTVGAGRVVAVENTGSMKHPRLRVTLAGPGGHPETLIVGSIIDCTGPGPDPTVDSPLMAGLVDTGLARRHPSGVGLDVDEQGDLRSASGGMTPVHTVGWCRRGAEFEAAAVPEIRRQAQHLARHMTTADAHRRPVLLHA